jgi:hypothetical protein
MTSAPARGDASPKDQAEGPPILADGTPTPSSNVNQQATLGLLQLVSRSGEEAPSPPDQVEGKQDQLGKGGVGLVLAQARGAKMEGALPFLKARLDGLATVVEVDGQKGGSDLVTTGQLALGQCPPPRGPYDLDRPLRRAGDNGAGRAIP